jgi:hypothetical protein
MITIEQIKNIADDIIADDEWVTMIVIPNQNIQVLKQGLWFDTSFRGDI